MNTRLFDEAFASLPDIVKTATPFCAVILGSGWNKAVDGMDVVAEVPYSAIPHFGQTGVLGHAGRMLLVRHADGKTLLVFCGRRHWYEGADWETVLMPVEIARRLRVPVLCVTNAAGGINERYAVGDMVVIGDHIRLNHLSPLRGAHHPEFGPRFPDQSRVYDPALMDALRDAGRAQGLDLATGVYVFSSGPVFETPAEIRAYRILGADLVGMSTVPEAMFASACGLRVAGISFVSNAAAGISHAQLSGEEVIENATRHETRMARLIRDFVDRVAES